MAEIDAIRGGVENQFVHSDYLALAEGSDLQLRSRVCLYDLLDSGGGSGGSVFFVDVVTFEDLPVVAMLERGGSGACDFKEQIDTDGKIGAEDESDIRLLNQRLNFRDLLVPASGSYDHALAGTGAG